MHDESVFFYKNCWQDTQIRSLLPPSFPYYILAEAFIGIQTIIPRYISSLFVGPHPLSNMIVIPARQSKSNPNEYLFFSLINHSSPLCLSTYDMQS